MRITVNNDKEKQLIETFLEYLHEEGLHILEENDYEGSWRGIGQHIGADEYRFLEDFIFNLDVLVNDSVREMTIEPHDIMGICSVCKCETTGTIDGEYIGYADYLHQTSKDSRENWKCETCFYKSLKEND